jgi:type IV secretion system protein VirB6
MSVCPTPLFDVGIVQDILGSVDCNVQFYSAAGYLALSGPASPLPAILTALLTIYVALLGYRMLFAVGSTRLADTPLIAVKIGVILALTLNWNVFQKLVFNVDADAPLAIGRVISRPMALGEPGLAADPVRGLQTAYDELNADAAELADKAKQNAQIQAAVQPTPGVQTPPKGDDAATASGLRRAAAVLLGSTAGVLAMAFIATGVLTAVGPLFIALFLFEATRGFFVGWMRALVAAMLTPMVCWIATSLLLVVMAPRIDELAQQRASHQISPDVAIAASAIVFIFAAAQAVLIVGGLLVASGFRIGARAPEPRPVSAAARDTPPAPSIVEARSRVQTLAANLQRSSSVYAREYGVMALAGDAGRDGVSASGGSEAPSRPDRLGETYRRGVAMRDRGGRERGVGAAGRA